MPPARDQVKAVFLAALDQATLADRAAFLEQACGPDADLRQRVEALLQAHDRTNLLLDRPAAEHLDAKQTALGDATVSDDQPGVVAGRYTLLQRIGEGGMGTVWMAEQTEPVKRLVALKLIKAGMDSQRVIARFEAERQALALMDHPHIAMVLDGGTTEAGRPFFVMEYVKGVPITQYCDEARLSIAERLALFVPVCQAVQHAHQKGVIHRDLKPSNLLVCRYDATPVPKVIDFGLAKAIHEPLTEHTLHTGHGIVVGTPLYMSPEQAGFNNLDVDTRTDIYALGVILYELLTGTTPLHQQRFQAAQEMLRLIREEEPPRPSARLSDCATLPAVAARRQLDAAGLTRVVRGELDWIVMKALERDRNRRYDTANSLARDVQRYLAGDVVEARPPSAGYRLRKFVRRHPLELALAGTLALLLVGGGAVAWWQNETSLRRQFEDEKRLAADNARLGRNTEAVAALLEQAEQAVHAGDAAKAAVALDAAKKRSAEGGAEKEAPRLARLDADLTLLRELDEVDQFRWTWSEDRFADPAAVATRTRHALRQFGADPEAVSVDEAAARVSASAVRQRIVTGLDRLLLQENTAGGRAVLRLVDADPYRDAVRDAVRADDRAKLVELAGGKAALEQPPGFVAFLGDDNFEGIIRLERRRQLLQAAVGRRPGDLGLLMAMAGS